MSINTIAIVVLFLISWTIISRVCDLIKRIGTLEDKIKRLRRDHNILENNCEISYNRLSDNMEQICRTGENRNMRMPEKLECKEDILRSWAYFLESMDLPCKECPVYDTCLQLEKRDSCYDVIKYALSICKKTD